MSSSSRYRPETGCAASAERRGDLLMASAPPAERWLLIEHPGPWPRNALDVLQYSDTTTPDAAASAVDRASGQESRAADGVGGLGAEVARLCREIGCRPVMVRRFGRGDRDGPRRWVMVDSRPGFESVRWGELPDDEHLLDVLSGADPGTPSSEPMYLVCTHGRHDACCAVRGRPVAAALAAVYPERTWECSHVGGDRFATNVVVLPHSLFYGHVTPTQAVDLARAYDEGLVVPKLLRGSGALLPPVQAAQHFARAEGHSAAVDALRPIAVQELSADRWQVTLDPGDGRHLVVEVTAHLTTINGQMTCAATPPGHVRQFTLTHPIKTT